MATVRRRDLRADAGRGWSDRSRPVGGRRRPGSPDPTQLALELGPAVEQWSGVVGPGSTGGRPAPRPNRRSGGPELAQLAGAVADARACVAERRPRRNPHRGLSDDPAERRLSRAWATAYSLAHPFGPGREFDPFRGD